jgi:hypothetical protein
VVEAIPSVAIFWDVGAIHFQWKRSSLARYLAISVALDVNITVYLLQSHSLQDASIYESQ